MDFLKVLAHGQITVLDVAYAARTGRLRFVGRKLSIHNSIAEAPAGVPVRERDPIDPGDKYYVEAWSPSAEPVLVPASGEFGQYFVQMVKEGGITPADKATADFCGVPFVGGE